MWHQRLTPLTAREKTGHWIYSLGYNVGGVTSTSPGFRC